MHEAGRVRPAFFSPSNSDMGSGSMGRKLKPNRRIERRQGRGRYLLLLIVPLVVGAFSLRHLIEPSPPFPAEAEPASAEAEEVEPEAPSGPRALPATVVARTAMESFPLQEGELQEGLHADAFFVLESEHALADLRLRLLDPAHKLVPVDETIEVGRGTRYRVVPKEALKPGTQYTLVVDGQEGDQPTDVSGDAYLPARFTLVVAEN